MQGSVKLFSIKIIAVVVLIGSFGCMSSFLKTPAVPMRLTASGELDYISSTDRLDSKQNTVRAFFFPHSSKVQAWKKRDEQRLKRVTEIYAEDSVRTDQDKWNAAIIFLHGGSEITKADTVNYNIAYKLFDDLSLNATAAGMKRDGKIWKKVAQARKDDLTKRPAEQPFTPTPILPKGR
ncbi:MAG TPA: hypothetical protein VGO45_03395 [Bacteroidia bacterium]|jgi:hypothetical protein|nr:hypothetical protein [Bacteroidia bacterium]